ncbi:unnamed protein product [Dovyalis caffra]|uniref:Uncharacterized protein n=1 Tax=Dovyalis caffra TaxID=77055 RepID=A0AAV1REA2_9ROSI|nr:unnamed protein product [Dovyalis caffra]
MDTAHLIILWRDADASGLHAHFMDTIPKVHVIAVYATMNVAANYIVSMLRLLWHVTSDVMPETGEEKLLKEQIEHLKKELDKELTTKVNREPQQVSVDNLPSLRELITEKERELVMLVRDLDDKVRFGPKAIERPGSGAGRASGFSERPPSRSGSFDESRSMEFMDRPRSRGQPDIWTRPADERKSFQGGRERGFLGSRDFDRSHVVESNVSHGESF